MDGLTIRRKAIHSGLIAYWRKAHESVQSGHKKTLPFQSIIRIRTYVWSGGDGLTDQQINIAVARADLFIAQYGRSIMLLLIMLVIFIAMLVIDIENRR